MRTHTTPRATIAQTRWNSYISTWFIMSSFATSQLSAIFWEKSQNYTIASCILVDLHAQEVWFPRCTQRIISMDVFWLAILLEIWLVGFARGGVFWLAMLLENWLVGFARGGPHLRFLVYFYTFLLSQQTQPFKNRFRRKSQGFPFNLVCL